MAVRRAVRSHSMLIIYFPLRTQRRGCRSGALFCNSVASVGKSGDRESLYNLVDVLGIRKMVIQLD